MPHPSHVSLLTALVLSVLVAGGCGDEPAAPPGSANAPASAPAQSPSETPSEAPATESVALRADLTEYFRLIEGRRTGPARVRLRRLLDADASDGQAAFLFGLSYHREKRYGLARPWFEQAAEHAPDYDVIEHFLGWCLYYLGESAAARTAFEAHLQRQPDTADSHFALGLLDLDDDRLEDAERRFDTALALFEQRGKPKDYSKVLTRRAEILIQRGAFEQARDDLLRAVAIYPDHYEAHYKLIRLHLRLDDQEAAEAATAAFIAAHERVHPTTSFPE